MADASARIISSAQVLRETQLAIQCRGEVGVEDGAELDLLARHPDQRRILIEQPGRIAGAVEETLRYDPPSHYQGRTTTREVALHGRSIPQGAKVAILNAATGRDERKYPDPDRWDVTREFDLHLNFGYGRHICLGKNLALLESRIATEEFLKRFPDYQVVGRERMHSSNVRGLRSLQIAR